MRAWMLGLMLASTGTAAVAADQEPRQVEPVPAERPLDFPQVFGATDLSGSQPRALKLSPDGTLLTSLRPRADDRERFDLWALDTAHRRRADAGRLRRRSAAAPSCPKPRRCSASGRASASSRGIVAYDWSPDGSSILVPLDGDLYLAGARRRRRTAPDRHGRRRAEPDDQPGRRLCQLRPRPELVCAAARRRAPRAADDRGRRHHPLAARRSSSRRRRWTASTGYWWSPDERYIAVERFDEAPVGVVTRAAIGATGTRVYRAALSCGGHAQRAGRAVRDEARRIGDG